ncbi:MAG: glycoside hydrolase family 32 protein [Anaerolineaceae bacterium]|nr:glycoside hydrolase family 32 protein [Anaerolineaceae bacterium]
MTSEALREARRYEEVAEQYIPDSDRPGFHLSTRAGWMNDPNGFSFYKGQYHLFHQYYPYEVKWGPMHWAHAVSDDLLHWRYLPAALAPDSLPDRDGCFSGSAVELPDGRQLLMYTGVVSLGRRMGEMEKVIQHQCIAVGDGIDYEKYPGNPVLSEKDIPENCHREDFRDPKMWQEPDGSYRCVVAVRPADESGMILLYSSQDGFHWKFESILVENHCRFGRMWECPDFFELDGKYVLLTSPQDMLPEGFEYHNGNGTLCLIGSFDEKPKKFHDEYNQAVDYGIDFYAPQTMVAPDGRRIMIAWMQNWDTLAMIRNKAPWFGQMTIPREIHVKNNRLYQWPIRELETLRHGKVEYHNVILDGEKVFEGIKGREVDLTVTVRPAEGADIYNKFAIMFGQDETYHTSLSFHPSDSIMKIDRKFSGSRRAVIHQRRSRINHDNGAFTMRIILDRFSAEIFLNNGEQTITITMYTDLTADGISFITDGKIVLDIEKYDLTQA